MFILHCTLRNGCDRLCDYRCCKLYTYSDYRTVYSQCNSNSQSVIHIALG